MLFVCYYCQSEDNGTFKTIAAFECRGMEAVDFDPRVCYELKEEGGMVLWISLKLGMMIGFNPT